MDAAHYVTSVMDIWPYPSSVSHAYKKLDHTVAPPAELITKAMNKESEILNTIPGSATALLCDLVQIT